MTRQADVIRDPALEQAVHVLGGAFAHQSFTHLVATKTVLSLECLVHGHHLGVLAVTDRALESPCPT